MAAPSAESPHLTSRRTYALVFAALASVTLVELLLSQPSISAGRGALNSLFLLLSLTKASLVAAFFMHLRTDSRLYTYTLVLPLILLLIFAYLASIS